MFILRPIRESDEEKFIALALHAHAGITSLSKDPTLLRRKLERALVSFEHATKREEVGVYLFVLENSDTQELVGLSAIYTNLGIDPPLYYYSVEEEELSSKAKETRRPQRVLRVIKTGGGSTELGTLFLKHEWRKEKLGALLSLSRFLFIAAFPTLFADKIHANMRGYFDDEGKSPFWEHFGRHFVDLDYAAAIEKMQHDKANVPSFLPAYPVYLFLMPDQAKNRLGEVHPHTLPALKMLEQQGFQKSRLIDLFDAGPLITCNTHEIHSIAYSRIAHIGKILAETPSKNSIVATHRTPFATSYGYIEELADEEIALDAATCRLLHLSVGKEVRFIYLRTPE